ncbi:leucine rich repeat domain protein [Reticulomyxa filosa]|uniref:Leucine rich repeat domain protein n=1 Tax=Reticulomyxa filosa TaxID=46433 RepID=X6LX05_RETFI|nr:leucine rich repeat domain protein [Reticulomyxa filosa]|eukprot:ETO06458.1 leucine rich repeat domain protein [Reticulomyxa filosa]
MEGVSGEEGKLKLLSLSNNKLYRTSFLDHLKSFPKLETLQFSENELNGSVPWAQVSQTLMQLQLQSNQLTGPLTMPDVTFPNLQCLSLDNNQFTGKMEWNEIWRQFPNLEGLYLSWNNISGALNWSQFPPGKPLWYLDIRNNNFSGTLEFEGMPSMLSLFRVDGNGFIGDLNLTALYVWLRRMDTKGDIIDAVRSEKLANKYKEFKELYTKLVHGHLDENSKLTTLVNNTKMITRSIEQKPGAVQWDAGVRGEVVSLYAHFRTVDTVKRTILFDDEKKSADTLHVVRAKVLLIDEVDVFFNKEFYGSCYSPAATL